MNLSFVNLIKNQFCANWEDARTLIFTDPRRTSLHASLDAVYNYFNGRDFNSNCSENYKRDLCLVFETFAHWTEILHLESVLPSYAELKKTIEHVLEEWIGAESSNLIISISEGEYAFSHIFLDVASLNGFTEVGWNIHFDYLIVDLRAPRYFFEDIFTNSVLFHEIGHFIDFKQHFSDDVYTDDIEPILLDPSNNTELINQSFPFLANTGFDKSRDEAKVRSHIKEYFADIFGAQYVGEHIMNHVLRREDVRLDIEDDEHPCCNKREAMVKEFLICDKQKGTTNILLSKILDRAKNANGDEMKIHFGTITNMQFIIGKKINVTNDAQLYGVFKSVWDLYLRGMNIFKPFKQPFPWKVNSFEWYKKLNQLAKDSVNTYI